MLSDSEKNKLKELGFDLVGVDETIQSFAGEAHQEPVPRGEETTSEPRMNLDDMLKACTDKDHWKVGQDMIFRVHVIPRRHMYEPVPRDFPGDLGYTRETHRFFEDGLHDVVHSRSKRDDKPSGPSVDRFQLVSQAERQPARPIRHAEATTRHSRVQGFRRREIRPGDGATSWKETA